MKLLIRINFVITLLLSVTCLFGNLTFTKEVNTNKYEYTLQASNSTEKDLFFSIGPNGYPQYGDVVNWELSETDGLARFYYFKKGDFGLTGHSTTTDGVVYSQKVTGAKNPGFDMEGNSVKIETSWDFAPESYNIVMIGIENTKTTALNTKLTVSYPAATKIVYNEYLNYNDWITEFRQNHNQNMMNFEFDIDDFEPGEIRYIYLVLDVAISRRSEGLSRFNITAKLDGLGDDGLSATTNPIPHDPNALYLLNSYYQGAVEDCDEFLEFPEMYQDCLDENLHVFSLENTPCVTWDFSTPNAAGNVCHVFDYPYCNVNQEKLMYRISCFN
ncbi:MAG: hypothetical protein AAGK97_18625, partial [Bacteroidota bacterium]